MSGLIRRCFIATQEIKSGGKGRGKKKSAAAAAKAPAATPQEARGAAVREFAIDAARLAANTRCRNVVLLDVRGLSPVTDYMILATGTSTRQMRTVVDEVEEMGRPRGFSSMSRSGYEGESWVLVDFVDMVIHVMSDESRVFYDLDNLWGEAKRVDWQTGMVQAAEVG